MVRSCCHFSENGGIMTESLAKINLDGLSEAVKQRYHPKDKH